MRDYFAALAVRTLRPELGVQPRHRLRWEEVPEPPLDTFVAMSRDAGGARTQEPAHAEPAPRSNRRAHGETDPMESERAAPRSGRRHGARNPLPDHDDSRIAALAVPRAAAGAEKLAVPARAERVKTGQAQRPAITTPAIGDRRSPSAAGSHQIERRPEPPARLSVRDREPRTTEPAIRIHIGRVDVRAVTAAAPARATPRERTRALMSLDEYVQKRDRGGS